MLARPLGSPSVGTVCLSYQLGWQGAGVGREAHPVWLGFVGGVAVGIYVQKWW